MTDRRYTGTTKRGKLVLRLVSPGKPGYRTAEYGMTIMNTNAGPLSVLYRRDGKARSPAELFTFVVDPASMTAGNLEKMAGS